MTKTTDTIPAMAGLTADQLQECFALGATLEQVKDLAESGFGYDQIKTLAATLGGARASGNGLSAADLRTILDGQRKAMKPENEQFPGVSVYNTEGERDHPKALLRRETFFNGAREKQESLTPAEVDLYNRFDSPTQSRKGQWRAEIRHNGTSEELRIITEPNTLDARQSLPPLTQILRELLDGEAGANPDMLAARVAELEAKIRAMQPAGVAA